MAACPELDIASQGVSIEEARANLSEALTLFYVTAAPSEISRRFQSEVFVTQVEITPAAHSWEAIWQWFDDWFDIEERRPPDDAGFGSVVHRLSKLDIHE